MALAITHTHSYSLTQIFLLPLFYCLWKKKKTLRPDFIVLYISNNKMIVNFFLLYNRFENDMYFFFVFKYSY